MDTNALNLFRKLSCSIPEGYEQDLKKNIEKINTARIKLLCLAAGFLGCFLFFVDWKLVSDQLLPAFHQYYLWFDAILFGGALFFYLLIAKTLTPHKKNNLLILNTVCFLLLTWCAATSALEYYTHNSTSTLVIGALLMASGIYLSGLASFIILAASLATFILFKQYLTLVPVNFFADHLNLVGLTVFCWLLSRILYNNKVENFLNRQNIIEKNSQLTNEMMTREKAQTELKKTQKMLEQRVLERTQELLTVNTELKNEIIEREKMEGDLQQARKMESIGTLAGGIAHDFNNILFPIIGHTEMLIQDIPQDSPYRSSIDEVYAAALRARDLVKQILTFSRQERNELKLMRIQPVLKEVLKLIRSTIPSTIDIKQDINDDCGIIKADPTQIHQIIMNLATNAYHAMGKKGGELRVALTEIEITDQDALCSAIVPGTYLCLTVADTGMGMDNDLMQKIFDPFFSTKEQGKGTGMGLSVVHGIVKGMGGTIQVNSTPGKGSDFCVYFPLEKNFSQPKTVINPTSVQKGTERILLVDDEKSVIDVVGQMLEHLGYQVTSLAGSREALDCFRAAPDHFDMVITDMTMPGLTGDQLSAEMLKIRPDIPVLLYTGFNESISSDTAESIGIKAVLMKPITIRELARKIRGILDKKQPSL